eukprot:364467-Chlamydomonas_euryale.AAC.3
MSCFPQRASSRPFFARGPGPPSAALLPSRAALISAAFGSVSPIEEATPSRGIAYLAGAARHPRAQAAAAAAASVATTWLPHSAPLAGAQAPRPLKPFSHHPCPEPSLPEPGC